jgi:hypothetical protein
VVAMRVRLSGIAMRGSMGFDLASIGRCVEHYGNSPPTWIGPVNTENNSGDAASGQGALPVIIHRQNTVVDSL